MGGLAAASVALISLAFAVSVPEAQSPPASGSVKEAEAVIERTKTTRIIYSVYNWNILSSGTGADVEEWSAEFNSANKHRVETPHDRIVADCRLQTGSWLNLQTGAIDVGAGQAMAACGINTNKPILSEEWIGYVTTPFGRADRIRVADQDLIRTYDVSLDGVILRTVFQTNDEKRLRILLDVAVSYKADIPDPAMFDTESLQKSYVPEELKVPPSTPIS